MLHYQSYVKNHIYPQIGEVKVKDLTPALLDKWIRDMQKANYSHNTISDIHSFLHQALDYAVYPAQLINSNPVAYIKIPKNAPKNVVKRTVITPEQFNALLEKYPFGTPLYIPLLLLYCTGMRLGEVLGLSWADIDFAAKKINLSRQMIYINRRGYYFTTLKTESSKRYIIVGDYLLGELRRWQNRQVENEKQFGDSYVYTYREPDGHIQRQSKSLPAPEGEKVSLLCVYDNGQLVLRGKITEILKAEGLNALSFRHTHATRLIEVSTTPEAVACRLGHKNSDLTFETYVHDTPKVQEQIVKLQEETAAIFAQILQTKS